MSEIVLIPMRLGSSRLPRKGLRKVGGYTALELLARRLQRARRPAQVVLCTTSQDEDDPLAEHGAELGIAVYRGSRDDVLLRLTEAAEAQGADVAAEVDGDDLFCDPDYVDRGLELLEQRGADFLSFAGLPFGVTPNIVRVSALRRAVDEKAATDTATGIFNFITKSGRFRVEQVEADANHAHATARMTLDYPEDLAFFDALVDRLGERAIVATLDEVLRALRNDPELIAINAGLEERYWSHFRSQESSAEARSDVSGAATGTDN